MNYPCTRKNALRRLLSLTAALVLLSSLLAGCFGKGKEPDPTDDTGNLPNLVDDSSTPSSDPTSAPTDADIPENTAIVKVQVNVRSSPSNTAPVITQLDAGEEVEVVRIEPIGTVTWAYVSSESLNVMGWIVTDMLDMSNVQLATGSTSTPGSRAPSVSNSWA